MIWTDLPTAGSLRMGTLLVVYICLGGFGAAQGADTALSLPVDPAMGIATLPLWPLTQGSESAVELSPTLTVFLPGPGQGNGTAVIVAPGGAYQGLASNYEGRQVADWFSARGVTAFVLKYRLGVQNPFPRPLLDAQRAIRLVRSMSRQFNISEDRIGFVGFSAGGHLAATAGTVFHEADPAATDLVDRFSDRPDFLVLGYPWLNAMQPSANDVLTYCSALPSFPAVKCKEWEDKYTPARHVSAKTPPTFIYHTTDDDVVPVSACIDFYNALVAAGVPVEMHLFRHGDHGSGLGAGNEALDTWPLLLEFWMRGQGLLTGPPKAR